MDNIRFIKIIQGDEYPDLFINTKAIEHIAFNEESDGKEVVHVVYRGNAMPHHNSDRVSSDDPETIKLLKRWVNSKVITDSSIRQPKKVNKL